MDNPKTTDAGLCSPAPVGSLLPCPFCGKDAELKHSIVFHSPVVRCSMCPGTMGTEYGQHFDTDEAAIAAWNRRANNNLTVG